MAGEVQRIQTNDGVDRLIDYESLANKPNIPTRTSQLTNDSGFVTDQNYVHTDNNFTNDDKQKLTGIEDGAQPNVIESISVNGVEQEVVDGAINLSVSGGGSDLATSVKGSTAHIGKDFSKLVIRSNAEQSVVNVPPKNLWYGDAIRDKLAQLVSFRTTGTHDTYGRWVEIPSSSISGKTLLSGVFKQNVQYTIFLTAENYSPYDYPPMRVKYTDNTYAYVGDRQSSYDTPYVIRFVTAAGKTVDSLVGYRDSTYNKFYYDQCGVFEGVVSQEQFDNNMVGGLSVSATPLESGFQVNVAVPDGHPYIGHWDELTIYPNGRTTFLVGTEESGGAYSEASSKTLYDLGTVDMRATLSMGATHFDADTVTIESVEFECWSWSDGDVSDAFADITSYIVATNALKADKSELDSLSATAVTNVRLEDSYSSPYRSGNILYLTYSDNAYNNGYVNVFGYDIPVKGINTAAYRPDSYFAAASEFEVLQRQVRSLKKKVAELGGGASVEFTNGYIVTDMELSDGWLLADGEIIDGYLTF